MKFGDVNAVRVPRAFFARDTALVAREMIGLVLAHETREGLAAGVIVEVEAYLAREDPASHAFRGQTARNGSMFGPPGRAYVYLIYGVHDCFNVVTRGKGVGEAVLVRALEPLVGIELMRARRGVDSVRELCRGPGKLTQALSIGRTLDGADLVRGKLGLWRPKPASSAIEIATSKRVGITRAVDLPLRFSAAGHAFVSKPGGATSAFTRRSRSKERSDSAD